MLNTRRAFRRYSSKFRTREVIVDAILGRADGTVAVPGLPYGVYVREKENSPPYVVYNFRVPNVANLPVKVGVDYTMEGVPQVLTIAWRSAINIQNVPVLLNHALSHLIGGTDPLFIDTSQIVNGLVYVYGGMSIGVHGGWTRLDGKFIAINPDIFDISDHIPVSGARYSLVRADENGDVDLQDGDTVGSVGELSNDDIPELEEGYAGLAFARLYDGQVVLSTVITNPDVRDIRFATVAYGGTYVPAHHLTHESGGDDSIKLDDLASPDDNTDLNASASKHGLLPKLSGVATEALRGDGSWGEVSGGGGGGGAGDLYWEVPGTLSIVDDAALPIVVGRSLEIQSVIMYVDTPGSAGTTTIDIELNGTTIFGTQPSVAYDDPDQMDEVVPTTVDLVKGDILSLNVDAVATDAADLVVVIVVVTTGMLRQATFLVIGTCVATAGKIRIPNKMGTNMVLTGVYLEIDTAPTGADLIVDIHKDGTTIFTTQANRPTITDGNNSGYSETLDITAWDEDEYLTADVDQIGSTLAGSDLSISIAFRTTT